MKDFDADAEFAKRTENEMKLRQKLAEFASPHWREFLEDDFIRLKNQLLEIEEKHRTDRKSLVVQQNEKSIDAAIARAGENEKDALIKRKDAVYAHRKMKEDQEKLAAIDAMHRKINMFADMCKNYTDAPNLPGDYRKPEPRTK